MDGLSIFRFPIWILNRLCIALVGIWVVSFMAPGYIERFFKFMVRYIDLNNLLSLASSLSRLLVEVNIWLFGACVLLSVLAGIKMIVNSEIDSFWLDIAYWIVICFIYIGVYIVATGLFTRFVLGDNTLYEQIFDFPLLLFSLVPFLVWLIWGLIIRFVTRLE